MKPILLLLSCLVVTMCEAQKFSVTPRLALNTGIAEQRGKFRNAYSIGLGAEMNVMEDAGLKLFAALDMGINGRNSEPYNFPFRGNVTSTKIHYTNLAFQFSGGARYVFNEQKKVSPYVGIGAGLFMYHMQSHINDPNDPGDCGPVTSDIMHADKSFFTRVESGLRMASKWRAGNNLPIRFDVGLAFLRGTTADYVRMGAASGFDSRGQVFSATFVSPDNEFHDHAIGTIYRTPLRQLMFHAGVQVPLGSSTGRNMFGPRRSDERRMQMSF